MFHKIKQNAKKALKNNWGRAVAVTLTLLAVGLLFVLFEAIFYSIYNLSGYHDAFDFSNPIFGEGQRFELVPLLISTFTALCSFVVLSPLSLGIYRFYYRMISGETSDLSGIFTFFSSLRLFGRALWLQAQLAVRLFLWGCVFLLPGFSVIAFCQYMLRGQVLSLPSTAWSLGLVLGSVLLFVCMLLYAVVSLRYFLAPFYFVEQEECSPREAVRRSVAAMKESKGNVFAFQLTFLPWLLLCVFVVPLLFVLPYMMTAQAIYAKILITQAEKRRKETPF